MIRFSVLDKSQKEQWLPKLFALLYGNMQTIAPDTRPYEQQMEAWLKEVSPALDKAPRQILLCLNDVILAGYIQYYIRDQLLVVEEFQLKREYHRSLLFYRACKYLMSLVTKDLQRIEAYADKRNVYCVSLMEKLGMRQCEDLENSPFVHMAGVLDDIRLWKRR